MLSTMLGNTVVANAAGRKYIGQKVENGLLGGWTNYEFYDQNPQYTYSYDLKKLTPEIVWSPSVKANSTTNSNWEGIPVSVEVGTSWSTTSASELSGKFGCSGNIKAIKVSGEIGYSSTISHTVSSYEATTLKQLITPNMPFGIYYWSAVAYFDYYECDIFKKSLWDELVLQDGSYEGTEVFCKYLSPSCKVVWVRQDLPSYIQ